MNHSIVVAALVMLLCTASVLCGYCDNYYKQLNRIDSTLNQIAREHSIGFYGYEQTYSEKAKYVIDQLHAKIVNLNRNRGSGQCKALEDEIDRMNAAFFIEKEGLEDYTVRLQKLSRYLNDRDELQLKEVEKQKTLQMLCREKNLDLNDAVRAMNKTINEHAAKIRDQGAQIAKLQEEKRKLVAKVNKNAAAIDGQTGTVTGTEEPVVAKDVRTSGDGTDELQAPITNTTERVKNDASLVDGKQK
ncbi:uncharacterized protein LOC129764872 [Toxorhynchites rutilus septentrionalis]|uniref:uncharacterized protein LOC129764872 n=1 Tax=Toxorhynchites rutilus septentrionalis TaxID=329112 RepID=UPI0024791991|nr:uncharacterized protein LOC129764872 [Toxorhynchites rutilus septentrionalis]